MINSIQLENFQSHENTKITLSPGVTSIIGSSDSGKTAILRGLNWVVNNRPGGEAFRSSWGGDTFVKVETDDEVAVSRTKTTKLNGYFLDTPNNTEKFKAFGQGVPEEITQALNMDDENIQAQMEAPFLFSDNDGEVAKRLNEAANLEQIDISQSYLTKAIKGYNADLKQNKADRESIQEKISSTDFIADTEEALKVIEGLSNEYDLKEQTIGELDYLITLIETSETDLEKLDFISDALKDYKALSQLVSDYQADELAVLSLTQIVDKLNEIDKQLDNTIDIVSAKKDLKLLEDQSKEIEEEEDLIEELSDTLDDLEEVTEKIEELKESSAVWKKEFKELMPDVCPLCGEE